jgi:F-type H+-transporting ATPase subunit delta
MNEYRVSFRYARAVIDLAVKEGIAEVVLNDLLLVKRTIDASTELRTFLKNPVILSTKKMKVIRELFESKLSKLTFSFIQIITDKGRESLLRSIAHQYEDQYNTIFNRLPVEITSAKEFNDDFKSSMSDRIAKWTNKEVLAEYKTDPKLLGGFKLQIKDWVFDASIRNQLNDLRSKLVEGKSI